MTWRHLLPLACLALMATSARPAMAAVAAAPTQSLRLEIGKGRLLHLPAPAASLFVADPAIADIQVRSPRLVYLFGRSAGETSLFAVDHADRPILSYTVGVGYDVDGLSRALDVAVPRHQVRAATLGNSLLLDGRAATAGEAAQVVEIASRFVPAQDRSRILNRIAVDAPTQVHLRVRVAEVSREVVRQFGFNWEALASFGDTAVGIATGNPVVAANGFATRTGGADSLFGSIRNGNLDINGLVDALDEKGLVTILAEPNLTALSGVPASFLAGGEYPIPVPQDNDVITIEYKRFGVSLAFVATVTDGGRINLQVRPEVSQLSSNGALTLSGMTVPALTTRRVETTVDLASGQSFALAGLLQSGNRRDLRKFPGLGDVPVLGELFRSRRFERSETELVVIVTPYLVRPATGKLTLPEGALP